MDQKRLLTRWSFGCGLSNSLVRHRKPADTLRRHDDVYSLIVIFVCDVHNRFVLEDHGDHQGVVFWQALGKSSVVEPTTLTESVAVGIDR